MESNIATRAQTQTCHSQRADALCKPARTAGPELTADLQVFLAAGAGMADKVHVQKKSTLAAQAGQSREQNEHMNSATANGADKAFLTLRSQLALKGHSLIRTHADDGPGRFYVTRWGMVRELQDIAAVRVFAKQVGVHHG